MKRINNIYQKGEPLPPAYLEALNIINEHGKINANQLSKIMKKASTSCRTLLKNLARDGMLDKRQVVKRGKYSDDNRSPMMMTMYTLKDDYDEYNE